MKLLIFGTGGHAKTVIEAITAAGEHEVVGIVNETGEGQSPRPNIEIVASNRDALSAAQRLGAEGAVIALGDTAVRMRIAQSLGASLAFPVIIHPAAWVSPSCRIGEGTVVLAGSVVGADSVLGAHCIVNTHSSVDHDCVLGDFVHVCPGATVAGHVTIGSGTWIGAGATVVDHVDIADHAFVRAASLVKEPRRAAA
jgi:acetyltransferase EpsM